MHRREQGSAEWDAEWDQATYWQRHVDAPGTQPARPTSAAEPAEPAETPASLPRPGRATPVTARVVVTITGVVIVAAILASSLGWGSSTGKPPPLPPLITSSESPVASEEPSPSAEPLSPAPDSPFASPTPVPSPRPTASARSNPPRSHPAPTSPVQPAPGTRTAFAVIQAESFTGQSGTQAEGCADVGGGQDIGFLAPGDWLAYDKVDFGSTGATRLLLRFASGLPAGMSGLVEVRLDGIGNPPVGSAVVGYTGGWQNWITVPANLTKVTGVHTVYLTFTSSSGWEIGNINWFSFER